MYQYEKISENQYRVYGGDYDTVHICTEQEAQEIVATLEGAWLKELKLLKISELNANINVVYQAYISKYPDVEVRSFDEKARESFLVKKNSNTSLDDTPLLCSLVGRDKTKRNTLAEQVYEKVIHNAKLEAWGVITRDAIKAANSIEELNVLSIEISSELKEVE